MSGEYEQLKRDHAELFHRAAMLERRRFMKAFDDQPATVTPKDWQEPPPLFRPSSHPNPRVSRDRSGSEE